jgi:hypothetical protein
VKRDGKGKWAASVNTNESLKNIITDKNISTVNTNPFHIRRTVTAGYPLNEDENYVTEYAVHTGLRQ